MDEKIEAYIEHKVNEGIWDNAQTQPHICTPSRLGCFRCLASLGSGLNRMGRG